MLLPKKVKFRKWHTMRMNKKAMTADTRGTKLAFGSFGLKAETQARVRSNQIESARKAGYEYHAVSPNPNIFHESVIDGGLLIISRLPIVETRFHAFKTAAIMSDVLAMKGALYVKIDLSKVGGDFLHLVTTHT